MIRTVNGLEMSLAKLSKDFKLPEAVISSASGQIHCTF